MLADEAKKKAAATYNAAADTYDHSANSFWDRYGRRTVQRLGLRPGMRILDACCGSGASAIPAAEIAGRDGFVLGVDLAERLLDLGRTKAKARGLANVEFRTADILDLGLPDADFDAVICVFGIFFVPEMEAAVRELWRLVRPRGQLAITTWGPRFLEPVNTAFWHAVGSVGRSCTKVSTPGIASARPPLWERCSRRRGSSTRRSSRRAEHKRSVLRRIGGPWCLAPDTAGPSSNWTPRSRLAFDTTVTGSSRPIAWTPSNPTSCMP